MAPALRIVHTIARLNIGGAALAVLQLAAEHRRRGHDVLVVAGNIAEGEESMEYAAEELGVPLRRLPRLQRELSPRRDVTVTLQLRAIFHERRPHVVHTHTSKAGTTGRVAALLSGSGRPRVLVHTFHGHVLRGYFDARRERFFTAIERALARRTDAIVAVSDEVRADLVDLGVAPAQRIVVIPYGFDLAELADPTGERRTARRAELGIPDETFVVGFVGRLTPIKRPADLVRTLGALVENGVDATLVALGDGPDRRQVESVAHELGLADRCRLLGYRRDAREWYAAFDAFLLTSANEGTPVVAIEALAAGCPVVATQVGGTPTVVHAGESGILTAVGDTGGLARGLTSLARDPDLRARMSSFGREDMTRRFTTSRMADDVERLYEALLATKRP